MSSSSVPRSVRGNPVPFSTSAYDARGYVESRCVSLLRNLFASSSRIPKYFSTTLRSDSFRIVIPIEGKHLLLCIPATLPERGDTPMPFDILSAPSRQVFLKLLLSLGFSVHEYSASLLRPNKGSRFLNPFDLKGFLSKSRAMDPKRFTSKADHPF